MSLVQLLIDRVPLIHQHSAGLLGTMTKVIGSLDSRIVQRHYACGGGGGAAVVTLKAPAICGTWPDVSN